VAGPVQRPGARGHAGGALRGRPADRCRAAALGAGGAAPAPAGRASQPAGGGAPRGARRRPRRCRAAGQRRAAGRAGYAHAAGAAAPAAQPRRRARLRAGFSGAAAAGLLRHRLPRHAAGARAMAAAAAAPARAGHPPLRLPRPELPACGAVPAPLRRRYRGPCAARPPGRRCQRLFHRGGGLGGLLDGLLGARRPDDGHALRQPRPRRAAAPAAPGLGPGAAGAPCCTARAACVGCRA
jgi:hypothetical protein